LHVAKQKDEQLLDQLLIFPAWYRGILLAQMRARRLVPLLKVAYRRSDRVACEMVKGHTLEQVPEVLRNFDESSLSSLTSQFEEELMGALPRFSIRMQIDALRFLNREFTDTLELMRCLAESEEHKPETRSQEQPSGTQERLGRRRTTKQSHHVLRFRSDFS